MINSAVSWLINFWDLFILDSTERLLQVTIEVVFTTLIALLDLLANYKFHKLISLDIWKRIFYCILLILVLFIKWRVIKYSRSTFTFLRKFRLWLLLVYDHSKPWRLDFFIWEHHYLVSLLEGLYSVWLLLKWLFWFLSCKLAYIIIGATGVTG